MKNTPKPTGRRLRKVIPVPQIQAFVPIDPLMSALLAAQRDISAFDKDGENKFHGFNYTTADMAIKQAREVLHKHGLVLTVISGPTVTLVDASHENVVGKGKDKERVVLSATSAVVKITCAISHPASGKFIEITRENFAYPAAGRPLDKAILGAETSALGYLLRGLLFVPRTDADPNERDDTDVDPNLIGEIWVNQFLRPMCEQLEVSLGSVRASLVKRGFDPALVDRHPSKWPAEWKPRIKEGLAKHPRAKTLEDPPVDPDGADQFQGADTPDAPLRVPSIGKPAKTTN